MCENWDDDPDFISNIPYSQPTSNFNSKPTRDDNGGFGNRYVNSSRGFGRGRGGFKGSKAPEGTWRSDAANSDNGFNNRTPESGGGFRQLGDSDSGRPTGFGRGRRSNEDRNQSNDSTFIDVESSDIGKIIGTY